MELFTTQSGLADVLLRWLHIFAGIIWIGLLYYFNLIQAPFMNQSEAGVKSAATRMLVPRALFWFRWSALATWVLGVLIILIRIDQLGLELFGTTYGTLILSGMILGTVMFLNVWGVIWPKQKVVIGSAEAVAGGGAADPAAPNATRRALLASRTNVLLSIPMLFLMVAAAHGQALFGDVGGSIGYWLTFAVLTALVELNALIGLTGATKGPLEKMNPTVGSGVLLLAILYGVLLGVAGA